MLSRIETVAANRLGAWHTCEPVEECRALLHQRSFRIRHDLARSPLFQIEQLLDVARRAAERPGDVYYDAGNVGLDDKWGKIPVPQMPVEQVIERIRSANAWVIMKHVEVDRDYADVLDEFAQFVREIAGQDRAGEFLNPEMLVIITSPKRVTPFHFDAEINFLVQVHGSKEVWVCDPQDRSVVSEEDIERYYSGAITAGTFRPDVEAKALKFDLAPGEGVHVPSHGAHWVRNGNDISVSLSLNFEFPRRKYRDVYVANHYLRRLGLRPTPPGRSVANDRAKAMAVRAARGLVRSVKK